MQSTVYLPHASALNARTYYDKPGNYPITAFHQGKCYRYEGRYITNENEKGWKGFLSRITLAVLRIFDKQNWIDKLLSFTGQSLTHTYREIPPEELWNCVENKDKALNLYDHILMDWDPKTQTFSVEQTPETPFPENWIFQKGLEKYVLVVVPPPRPNKKRKKQLAPYLQGYYSFIPIPPTVKRVDLKVNAACRLQLCFHETVD